MAIYLNSLFIVYQSANNLLMSLLTTDIVTSAQKQKTRPLNHHFIASLCLNVLGPFQPNSLVKPFSGVWEVGSSIPGSAIRIRFSISAQHY